MTTFLVTFFLLGLIIPYWPNTTSEISSISDNPSTLNPAYSTNPLTPVTLVDDMSVWETYDVAGPFYYDAFFQLPPTKSYYHLVWLYCWSATYNYDLFLYSDSSYSIEVGNSQSSTKWDWIVYRISSAKTMYPKVTTVSAVGFDDADIEYEAAVDMDVGLSFDIDLDSAGEIFELLEINLASSKTYTFTLNVPATADFDMVIFRTAAESSTQLDVHKAETLGAGADETITFSPDTSTWYAVVIFLKSGSSGIGYLTAAESGIPGFEIVPILIGFGIVVLFSLISRKNRKILL